MFSKIFLDYIGSLSLKGMDLETLNLYVKICYMIWNSEFTDEIALSIFFDEKLVPFFKERKT